MRHQDHAKGAGAGPIGAEAGRRGGVHRQHCQLSRRHLTTGTNLSTRRCYCFFEDMLFSDRIFEKMSVIFDIISLSVFLQPFSAQLNSTVHGVIILF